MTDSQGVTLAEALADKSHLGTYQDEPVLRTSIKLTKAGDGLSKAMKIDPDLLPIGTKGMLLVGYEVTGHTHKRITDTEAFELVQTLSAETVTVFEGKAAEKALERQRRKIEEADMRAKNVRPLKDADPGFNPDGGLDGPDDAGENEDDEHVDRIDL